MFTPLTILHENLIMYCRYMLMPGHHLPSPSQCALLFGLDGDQWPSG